jgi:hypothetical protein
MVYWIHTAIGTRASGVKKFAAASCELRLRAGTGAVRNGITDFSRPRCVRFQAAVGILDEAKAGFKGLEKYPETTGETGDGPCDKYEEDQPKEGKARIVGHCCCWMGIDCYCARCKGLCLCDHKQTSDKRQDWTRSKIKRRRIVALVKQLNAKVAKM